MRLEAQAIVFAAGPGSRLTSVGIKSKCLLPIGNFPMVYYPLLYLENNGFEEATVIINQRDEKEFKKLNEQHDLKIKLDLVNIDTSTDPGTMDSLRLIENRIKKNVDEVVLVSSDLITDCSLERMFEFHRSRGAALTALMADQPRDYLRATPPGPKSKVAPSNDVICFEEGSCRLVYAVSAGDYDDQVSIPGRSLGRVGEEVVVETGLLDAHLYIASRRVLDYVLDKDCSGMGSLKAEVIPHLVNEQFRQTDPASNGLGEYTKPGRYEELIRTYNTSTVPSKFHPCASLDARSCYLFRHNGAFCVRINTLPALWHANKTARDIFTTLGMKTNQSKNNNVHEKSQICDQSLIGRGSAVSEKTNLVSVVLGENCHISAKVRVSNSVLFSNVRIAEGCVIENSLVCVSVAKRCIIRNCVVTLASKIQEGATYEGELLESGLSQEYSF